MKLKTKDEKFTIYGAELVDFPSHDSESTGFYSRYHAIKLKAVNHLTKQTVGLTLRLPESLYHFIGHDNAYEILDAASSVLDKAFSAVLDGGVTADERSALQRAYRQPDGEVMSQSRYKRLQIQRAAAEKRAQQTAPALLESDDGKTQDIQGIIQGDDDGEVQLFRKRESRDKDTCCRCGAPALLIVGEHGKEHAYCGDCAHYAGELE